jgi:REP element-mobilizing transposase RayT
MAAAAHLLTLSTHRRRFVLRGDSREIAWRALTTLLPRRCPGLAVDCAVVMPDRLYAIVRLPKPVALTPLVQAYKAATTRTIKAVAAVDRVWQKGFEHREIRDEAELIAVRALIKSYDRAT